MGIHGRTMSICYIACVIAATLSYCQRFPTPTPKAMPSNRRKQQNRDAQRRYREKKKRELDQKRSHPDPIPTLNDISSSCLASPIQRASCPTTATQSAVGDSQGKLICLLLLLYWQKCF